MATRPAGQDSGENPSPPLGRTGVHSGENQWPPNGLLEGLNSVIQASKRRAGGYRSTGNFIAMIYLVAGKLQAGPVLA